MTNTPNYSKEIDTLKSDVAAVRGDIASLTNAIKGDAANGLDKAARNFSKSASHAFDTALAKERDAQKAVTQQVQENPLQSMLVAVGLGFVVGSLMRR